MTLITPKEAGVVLGISAVRVRQLIEKKRIKSVRVGRFHMIELAGLRSFKKQKPGRPKKAKPNGR